MKEFGRGIRLAKFNKIVQEKLYPIENLLKQAVKTSNILRYSGNVFMYSTSTTAVQNANDLDKLYKIVELELKGNDPAVLKSFAKFATTAGNHFNIESKSWNLRKPLHEKYTVLKSVHIYKKHRVQYEHRTYFTFVQYKHLTESTADTLLEYVERNLPEGVALKATKVELQALPEHFTSQIEAS